MNFIKFQGDAIRLPQVSADPSSPPDGAAWYNTTTSEIKFRQNGATIVLGQVSSEFSDAVFRVVDDVDSSKKLAIELSSVGAGQTRTISMPDVDVDLSDIAANTAALALKADASDLANYVPVTDVGNPNGVASLDSGGKLPAAQLPTSVTEYRGAWNADTNTPSLADGSGINGDLYRVSVAGTIDLGSGPEDYLPGDAVIYNGSIWEKIPSEDVIQSVNGLTGVVTLQTSDIPENVSLYFTNARALAATLTAFSAGSDVALAPSDTILQAFQKLQGQMNARISSLSEDPAPQLAGALDTNGQALLHNADGLEKGQAAGDTYFDDYDHNIALAGSTSAIISEFTVSASTYDAFKVDYRLFSASNVRVGTLFVASNGSVVSLTDQFSETGDTQVSFSAALNAGNIEVSFNNPNAGAGTLRAQSRRFRA